MDRIGEWITENYFLLWILGTASCVAIYLYSERRYRLQQKHEAMFDEVNSAKYDDDQIQ